MLSSIFAACDKRKISKQIQILKNTLNLIAKASRTDRRKQLTSLTRTQCLAHSRKWFLNLEDKWIAYFVMGCKQFCRRFTKSIFLNQEGIIKIILKPISFFSSSASSVIPRPNMMHRAVLTLTASVSTMVPSQSHNVATFLDGCPNL